MRYPWIRSPSASQNAYPSSHLKVVGTEVEVTVEPAFFHRQPRGLTIARGDTRIDHTFERSTRC